MQVYIENAAKPQIGGFTIPLPTTRAVLAPWLEAIDADGADPGSIKIVEIRSSIAELGRAMRNANATLDELNYLAAKIAGIGADERDTFLAALEAARHSGDARSLINLAENLRSLYLQPAFNETQYGEFLLQADKDGTSDVFVRLDESKDAGERDFAQYVLRLESMVDPAVYARSTIEAENGVFTKHGYLSGRDAFKEVYHGPRDIPPEYRIFLRDESQMMDKEKFWQIIDGAREAAGSWQEMRGPLADTLSKLDAPDILHWQQIFHEYAALSEKPMLWAAAHVMMDGCSDDSFDYFRGWLIAQGRDVYMGALAEPDSLASVAAVQAWARETVDSAHMAPLDGYRNDPRFEEMMYAGIKAYDGKTGRDFYDDAQRFPLPQAEKAAIADEIRYAEDIDAWWFDGVIRPEKLVPLIHGAFHPPAPEATAEIGQPGKPAEKESVIEKIRRAKEEARAAPKPAREKERGTKKKSYEPEV